jgi:hypothetical protein
MPMVAFHPIHTPTYHYHYSSHNIHNIMLLSHFKQYPLCLPATLIYFIPSILPLISYKTRQLYLQAQTAHTRKSAPANSYSTIIKAYIPLQLNQATTKIHRLTMPSDHTTTTTAAAGTQPAQPLIRLFVWRCATTTCELVNETLCNEAGRVRELPTGYQIREPCWYGATCEDCGGVAGRETCLLEVKLVEVGREGQE